MADDRRLHCIHCGQTFLTADSDTCPLCRTSGGLVDPADPVALHDRVNRKQDKPIDLEQVGQALFQGTEMVGLIQRLLKLGLGGVLLLVLGAWLLLDPNFRTDPRSLSFNDLPPALGAMVVGVVLLLMAYLTLWNARQSWRKERENKVTESTGQKPSTGST
jgi:hypothetical protein